LDEIGEVPLTMQVKLLRLIQDKEIVRIGGKTPISIDVRIIAATNRDLSKMVKEGKFREDLYYRLNVIPIHIPPLRERREDIHVLVLNIIKRLNEKYGTEKRISLDCMDKLINYSWPGNVRELENIVERIAIMTENDIIEMEDLPPAIRNEKFNMAIGDNTSLKSLLNAYEKDILETLLSEQYSVSEIARKLGIDITNVRRKLHKYGLEF